MPFKLFLMVCLGSVLLGTAPLATFAGNITISIGALDPERRPTLILSGLDPGHYGVQASTNLADWETLYSGSAVDGKITYQHTNAVSFGTRFYRGIVLSNTPPPVLVSLVDSNSLAMGIITPDRGGSLEFTNLAGVRFKFSVGPSNVVDPVAITMQLVTNMTGLPASPETHATVEFHPSGFQFHGAGLLEIEYPTNVPHLMISSFAFNGDGSGFHLTPDVVGSNFVRIPVTHFSSVGAGRWLPTERTKAVTTYVENTKDRMSHDLGAILGRDRQAQLLGAEPDLTVGDQIDSRTREYYDKHLKPFFNEARGDCALARFLTTEILGLERQRQLLGMGGDSSFLASEDSKAWMCNCQQEAITACEEGRISDTTLIRTLLGIERQSQLLGAGEALEACGQGNLADFLDRAQNRDLPCIPEWYGYIEYSDGGSRSWSCSTFHECRSSTATALSLQADVETVEMEDSSWPPFFYSQTWRLRFVPEATGFVVSEGYFSEPVPCGNLIQESWTKGANSGPMEIVVEFVVEDGEVIDFVIETTVHKHLEVKTSSVTTTTFTGCPENPELASSYTTSSKGEVYLAPAAVGIDQITFTKRTPTALEGTAQGWWDNIDAVRMPFSWKFSLRRQDP